MAITKYPPNTIWLGGTEGKQTIVNDIAASEIITPGMLIELTSVGGVPQYRKHANAGKAGSVVALDQNMLNKGVDDTYAAGDLVEAMVGKPGDTFWMLLASGQNVLAGAGLTSNGAGLLTAVSTNVLTHIAKEAKNNTAGPGSARIRVEVV